MEIIGYSERGVMNALFYGIAFDKDSQKAEEAMNEILKLGGIKGDYTDFKIYVEFSLSEFGSPDLVFTASNSNGEKEVFFVEAKVSAGSYYDLDKQKDHHDDYMKRLKNSKYDKGHSSNLFFISSLRFCGSSTSMFSPIASSSVVSSGVRHTLY